MLEVFSEAIRPINLPFSILLGAVILYWLLVAIGLMGMDFGADADIDADIDGTGGDFHGGPFSQLLNFVNIGEVPITIVLSILTLCIWTLSMLVNSYWTGSSLVLGLVAYIPIFLVSLVLTRFLTLPFLPLMRALNREGDEHLPLVGRTCTIITSEATARFGQAQIETKGAPILINVRTSEEDPLPKGATGLIVRKDGTKDVFYVVPVTSDRLE